MVNFLDMFGHATQACYTKVVEAGATVKKGVLIVGEGSSRVLHDIYCLNGLTKGTKALIADLKLAAILLKLDGLFDGWIKTLEAQKDLYYATQIFDTPLDFITKDRKNFCLPRLENDNSIDCLKICYAFANFFDTAKFLQKYKIVSFERCTYYANIAASINLFPFRGQKWLVDDIIILQTIPDRPKDIFVFFASLIELYRAHFFSGVISAIIELMRGNIHFLNNIELKTYCKVIPSIGKITLISSARYYYGTKRFALVDAATQTLPAIGYLWGKKLERDNRLGSIA